MEEAAGAAEAGAHRLELCVGLETGGITPPVELLRAVKAEVGIPVFTMARLRPGAFAFTPMEVADTLRQIAALAAAGADGVVVGFLDGEGRVDMASTAQAVRAAGSLPVTFHRAFDETLDLLSTLHTLAGVGVARVLTGGGPGAARDHADALAALVRASTAVEVLVGGRVRGDHVRHLVAYTGAREVHARAEGVVGVCRALAEG